jgi:hypothetical protein
MYDTDARKIQFTMSYLEGAAKAHVMTKAQKEPTSIFFFDWTVFISEMQQFFGEHNPRGVVQHIMRTIKMGDKESFVNYVVRFQEAALDSGFNDPAMKSILHQTINTRLLKMLVTVPEADSYTKLVQQCLTLDQRVDDVDTELKLRMGKGSTSVPQIHGQILTGVLEEEELGQQTLTETQHERETPSEYVTADDDIFEGIGMFEELSLRAIGVSLEERKRRRDNALCYYCGEKGHFMRECPKAKKQTQPNTASARGISIIMPDESSANFLEDLFPGNY